jgi:hypothetical protein
MLFFSLAFHLFADAPTDRERDLILEVKRISNAYSNLNLPSTPSRCTYFWQRKHSATL